MILRKKIFLQKDETSSWTPAGKHNRRVRNLILIGGILTAVFSSIWGTFYFNQGNVYLLCVNALSTLAGLALIALALANYLHIASILMSHALVLVVTLASLGDVPIDGIERSVHMNLLPVAAATFFMFYNKGFYLRAVLPSITLLLFLAFALDLPPLPGPEFIASSSGRSIGMWSNNITSIVGSSIVFIIMQSNVNARSSLENDMRLAVARGEYYLNYQPQVDSTGRIFGVEALLRWTHPTRGNIPPQEFIPMAEQNGLIIPIGDWVLRTACAQLAEWRKSEQTAQLIIAVNVSASQFRQPDFAQQVESIVSVSGADPTKLKLELTESALVDDIVAATKKMQTLKKLGITWSLDDFGTGYSSLSSLKRLPLDQLKIDRSFVRDLLSDVRSVAIIDTIIQLSHTLELAVIAEGVENEEQMMALNKAGCASYQGYLFSPPLPISAVDDLILATFPRPSSTQQDHLSVA